LPACKHLPRAQNNWAYLWLLEQQDLRQFVIVRTTLWVHRSKKWSIQGPSSLIQLLFHLQADQPGWFRSSQLLSISTITRCPETRGERQGTSWRKLVTVGESTQKEGINIFSGSQTMEDGKVCLHQWVELLIDPSNYSTFIKVPILCQAPGLVLCSLGVTLWTQSDRSHTLGYNQTASTMFSFLIIRCYALCSPRVCSFAKRAPIFRSQVIHRKGTNLAEIPTYFSCF
jgi:hypothetical protein